MPTRNIALGSTASKQALGKVKMTPAGPGDPPLPSWFKILGTETGLGKSYSNLIDLMNTQGKSVMPGKVVNFPVAIPVAGEKKAFTGAYELPYIAYQNYHESTLQFDGKIANYITAPALTLAVWSKGDRRPVVTTKCDDFANIRPGTRLPYPLLRNGWRYESLSVPPQAVQAVDRYPAGAPDGLTEITGLGGVSVTFDAPVDVVTVDLVQTVSLAVVRAYNSSNGLIAQMTSQSTPNAPQNVTVSGAGIMRITVSLGASTAGGDLLIRKICTSRVSQESGAPGAPIVTGVEQNTSVQVAWPGQMAGTAPAPGGGTLYIYRFLPNQAKIWKSFRIESLNGSHVLVLGLSGIDWVKQDLSNKNEDAKDGIKDNLDQNGNQNQPVTEKHALLEPGASYDVVVDCDWTGWMKDDDKVSPPTLGEATWTSFATQTYTFKVASETVPADSPRRLRLTSRTRRRSIRAPSSAT